MGAWAKGIDFKNASGTTVLGGLGLYGVDTTANKVYIGLSSTPWSGGLEITKDKVMFNNKELPNADHTHDDLYFKKSGDILTGNVRYSGAGWTGDVIKFSPDVYGPKMTIGGGGPTILGAGESVFHADGQINGLEDLHLTSDNNIYFYSNVNTGWDSRKVAEFRSDGEMYVNNNKVYHKGNIPTADEVGAVPKKFSLRNFRVYRDVVAYTSDSQMETGVLKITMPKSWSSTMMSFSLRIYDYSDKGYSEYKLAGYNAGGSTNSWARCSATIEGFPVTTDIRFAHDGNKCCVLIGTVDSQWRYLKAYVHEFMAGFSSQTDGWDTDWSISVEASEANIDTTKVLSVTNNAHKSHGHNVLMNSYEGLTTNDGYYSNYLRTTLNGIIPYAQDATNGYSYVGTTSWRFRGMWTMRINDYTIGASTSDLMNSILATDKSGHVTTGVQMNFNVGQNMESKSRFLRLDDGEGFRVNDGFKANEYKFNGDSNSKIFKENNDMVISNAANIKLKLKADKTLEYAGELVPTITWARGNNSPSSGDGKPKGTMHSALGDDSELWIKTGVDTYEKLGLANKKDLSNRVLKDGLSKKKIAGVVPFKFKDYDTVLAKHGGTHLYPQGFDIDKENNEIIVGYNTAGDLKLRARTVVIYDLNTLAYKGYVECVDCGGESVIVRTENNIRYLYLKYSYYDIGKYKLDVKATYSDTLPLISSVNVGCDLEFAQRDDTWLVEQTGATYGITKSRKLFHIYDKDFKQKSSLMIQSGLTGNFSDYSNNQPKRQGISLYRNTIFQSSGGYWDGTSATDYGFTGISILDIKGDLLDSQLYSPLKFKELLESNSIVCNRIENEGISITDDGDIYTLYITKTYKDSGIDKDGIVLLKEFTDEAGHINFTSAIKPYQFFNQTDYETMFPRSGDGKMHNPLDGSVLDSIEKIYNFMKATDFQEFGFYSSSVEITDLDGSFIPDATIVKIKNGNNKAMYMEYIGFDTKKTYFIYDSNGVIKSKQIDGFYPEDLALVSGVTSYYKDAVPRASMSNNTVTISGAVTGLGSSRPFKIATIPVAMRPKGNMSCVVPISASGNGGYAVVTAMNNGDLLLNYMSGQVNYVALNGISYHV